MYPWGSVASQPRLLGEPQASENSPPKGRCELGSCSVGKAFAVHAQGREFKSPAPV